MFICVLIVFSVNCVFYVFLQYFDNIGYVSLSCKDRRPYNLYCVGGDVKQCLIKQSIGFHLSRLIALLLSVSLSRHRSGNSRECH